MPPFGNFVGHFVSILVKAALNFNANREISQSEPVYYSVDPFYVFVFTLILMAYIRVFYPFEVFSQLHSCEGNIVIRHYVLVKTLPISSFLLWIL